MNVKEIIHWVYRDGIGLSMCAHHPSRVTSVIDHEVMADVQLRMASNTANPRNRVRAAVIDAISPLVNESQA